MRILGGRYKNIKLLRPSKEMKVRPFCNSAKEMIFNILVNKHLAPDQRPAFLGRVADLFCGSGSLGLEALSRGAEAVTFVDRKLSSLKLLQQNLDKLKAEAHCVRADVRYLGKAEQAFDLIFVDPPFNFGLALPSLLRLAKGGWVDATTLIIVRVDKREALTLPEGFLLVQEKYNTGRILFLRYLADS